MQTRRLNLRKVVAIAICFAGLTIFLGCEKGEEKPITSDCDLNDPLQNIEWLREFCENLSNTQDFATVRIDLYKIKGTEEHLFQINVVYSSQEVSPFHSSTDWKKCTGELVFGVNSGVPPMPGVVEEFMKDKEFVSELFYYVMPLCGVNDPLQNIEWLKEYCESVKVKQDITSVRIDLYKSNDGYVFQIWTFFPYEYAPNQWTEYFSSVWRNCAGEELEFSQDFTRITDIFRFVKE